MNPSSSLGIENVFYGSHMYQVDEVAPWYSATDYYTDGTGVASGCLSTGLHRLTLYAVNITSEACTWTCKAICLGYGYTENNISPLLSTYDWSQFNIKSKLIKLI